MPRRKAAARKKKGKTADKNEGVSGTYVYDEKLGRIVKVSDRIPGIASRTSAGAGGGADEAGPCGQCEGGPCPMTPDGL